MHEAMFPADVRRRAVQKATALESTMMGISVPVDAPVPQDRCLPMPPGYAFPTKGQAKHWVLRVVRALARGRNVFVWGMPGTGMAFFLLYAVYTIVVYIIGYVVSRTTWTWANQIHIFAFGVLLAIVGLISALVINPWHQYTANLILLLMASVYCLWRLSKKSGFGFHALRAKNWNRRRQ